MIIFKEVIEQLAEECQKAGLLSVKRIIADVKLIEEEASLNFIVDQEKDYTDTC